MRKVSVSFHAGTIQPIIIGFFIKKNTQVLDKFKVSLNWTRTFMRSGLNWQFHKPTTTKGKLPNDWEKQGHIMVLWIIYSDRVSNLLLALLLTLIKQEYT